MYKNIVLILLLSSFCFATENIIEKIKKSENSVERAKLIIQKYKKEQKNIEYSKYVRDEDLDKRKVRDSFAMNFLEREYKKNKYIVKDDSDGYEYERINFKINYIDLNLEEMKKLEKYRVKNNIETTIETIHYILDLEMKRLRIKDDVFKDTYYNKFYPFFSNFYDNYKYAKKIKKVKKSLEYLLSTQKKEEINRFIQLIIVNHFMKYAQNINKCDASKIKIKKRLYCDDLDKEKKNIKLLIKKIIKKSKEIINNIEDNFKLKNELIKYHEEKIEKYKKYLKAVDYITKTRKNYKDYTKKELYLEFEDNLKAKEYIAGYFSFKTMLKLKILMQEYKEIKYYKAIEKAIKKYI